VTFDRDSCLRRRHHGHREQSRWSRWRQIHHKNDPAGPGEVDRPTNAISHDQPCGKVYSGATPWLYAAFTQSARTQSTLMASSRGGQVSSLGLQKGLEDTMHSTVLETPDPEKPEIWTFQILNTWKDDRGQSQITQPERLN
jgi:hypothetical protein